MKHRKTNHFGQLFNIYHRSKKKVRLAGGDAKVYEYTYIGGNYGSKRAFNREGKLSRYGKMMVHEMAVREVGQFDLPSGALDPETVTSNRLAYDEKVYRMESAIEQDLANRLYMDRSLKDKEISSIYSMLTNGKLEKMLLNMGYDPNSEDTYAALGVTKEAFMDPENWRNGKFFDSTTGVWYDIDFSQYKAEALFRPSSASYSPEESLYYLQQLKRRRKTAKQRIYRKKKRAAAAKKTARRKRK